MNKRFDLRIYKKELRSRYRGIRRSLDVQVKKEKDKKISENLIANGIYIKSGLLLIYVSTPEEINTRIIIEKALKDGKTVAVPYCVDGTRNMDFYSITSLDELLPGTFGVLEPVPDPHKRVESFDGALCVLPGIIFDAYGYRLGYGGGYYDRFLSKGFVGETAGLCYSACTCRSLKHGKYDVACGYIITENGVSPALPAARYAAVKPQAAIPKHGNTPRGGL